MSFCQTWLNFAKLDEILSNLMKLCHTWWNFVKLDDILSNLIKILSNLLKFGQTCWNLVKLAEIFSNLSNLMKIGRSNIWATKNTLVCRALSAPDCPWIGPLDNVPHLLRNCPSRGRCYDHNFLENVGVFLQNQCYDPLFAEFSSALRHTRQFFSPIFFGGSILKS
jgi:hypothetical protein